MKIKNKIFKRIFLLGLIVIFSGCIVVGPIEKMSYYTSFIYGVVEDGKINRMTIPENDINEMNRVISKKYGFWFGRTYNIIEAPRVFNRNYNSEKDFVKNHYIKFYDDIKIVIGNKKFVISKDEIEILGNGSEEPEYRYKAPIDLEKSGDNNIIIDLGVIEILNKDGEILRPKTKVPALIIKKVYKQ